MIKYILAIIALLLIGGGYVVFTQKAAAPAETPIVPEEQVQAPAQDLGITVASPAAQSTVSGIFQITGEAQGSWFFEGSFPIVLVDAQSNEVAYGLATADGEWMTESYVPFTGEIDTTGLTAGTYFVLLKKDNPSGLPENDAQTAFPVIVQ